MAATSVFATWGQPHSPGSQLGPPTFPFQKPSRNLSHIESYRKHQQPLCALPASPCWLSLATAAEWRAPLPPKEYPFPPESPAIQTPSSSHNLGSRGTRPRRHTPPRFFLHPLASLTFYPEFGLSASDKHFCMRQKPIKMPLMVRFAVEQNGLCPRAWGCINLEGRMPFWKFTH